MHFLKKAIKLNESMLNLQIKQVLSSCTAIDENNGIYNANSADSVIRYLLKIPQLLSYTNVFFSVKFKIEAMAGAVTHFCVVNHNVSDGCLWEIQPQDCKGVFALNGVLQGPLESLTFYINIKKPCAVQFKLIELTLSPLIFDEPLKIAFIIDPWLERSEPQWKTDYIWWFGQLENILRANGISVQSVFIMNDAVACAWNQYRPNTQSQCAILSSADLLQIFGSYKCGVINQRQKLKSNNSTVKNNLWTHITNFSATNSAENILLNNFGSLLKKAFPWEPDVVVSMSDMQILKDMFPEALVLYRDAIYCREPFPDELTSFDYLGLYKNAGFEEIIRREEKQFSLPPSFTELFFPKSAEILSILKLHHLNDKDFYLLPLQDSRHYNFYDECQYADQVEVVIAAAIMFPNDKILITQHPDRKEINHDALKSLISLYPNLVYATELEKFNNLSARVLPFAKGIIGVSTGILIQALMLGLPVKLMGRHALENLLVTTKSDEDRKKIACSLLTKVYASYRYLHNKNWLLARICALKLFKDGIISAEELAVDLPHNVFHYLAIDKRPIKMEFA